MSIVRIYGDGILEFRANPGEKFDRSSQSLAGSVAMEFRCNQRVRSQRSFARKRSQIPLLVTVFLREVHNYIPQNRNLIGFRHGYRHNSKCASGNIR
jgi:hypothetical protein